MEKENTYNVKVDESSRDLPFRDKLRIIDLSLSEPLDSLISEFGEENGIVLAVKDWALLHVHNEKSKGGSTDYDVIVLIDESGKMFRTGSDSFWSAFSSLSEACTEAGEELNTRVYKLPSKNFKDKGFLTCTIA